MHPEINTAKWRPQEDDQLITLVPTNGSSHWESIAVELGVSMVDATIQCRIIQRGD